MSKLIRSPFVTALLGGAVVAVVLLALGAGSTTLTRTTIEQAPVQTGARNASTGAPTARQIYDAAAPGVVFIRANVVQQNQTLPFGPPSQGQGQATGSGFVIDRNGLILTNAHVVNGASKVTVSFEHNATKDAKVVGKDESTDLALLKVDPSGLKLTPLPLGNSDDVNVGDPALAIGNPFGLDRTLTTGVISAKQRKIDAPNGFSIDNVLQTDAAINPGNSGGPLLDAAGRVIGINSQIATGGSGNSGNVGIGFAVPINTAKQILPQLESAGHVDRAYLGIAGVTIDSSFGRLGLKVDHGVLIQTVTPGGPAAKAGIRGGTDQAVVGGQQVSLGGDVVLRIGDVQVRTIDDLVTVVSKHKPGDRVQVVVERGGQQKTFELTLGNRPNRVTNNG